MPSMPTSSTINSSSKSKIKSSLPSSHFKILTATVVRVYVAHPDPSSWSYTGIEGGVAFVKLLNTGGTGFRVVDLKGTRGVIWDHDLYDGLVYNQDRSFFHTFEGDNHLIGFSFADEGEAAELYKKVNARAKYCECSVRLSPQPVTLRHADRLSCPCRQAFFIHKSGFIQRGKEEERRQGHHRQVDDFVAFGLSTCRPHGLLFGAWILISECRS